MLITSSIMPISAVCAISLSPTAMLRPVLVSLVPGREASITSSRPTKIPERRRLITNSSPVSGTVRIPASYPG